ncbi:MAG: 3-phosphoshikimate 1-carboxyvinyltransferase [Actinomycetota bacterium]
MSSTRVALGGEIRMPGDKSISHRALILAALARGRSRIEGLNPGADVRGTARLLTELGIEVELAAGNTAAEVQGLGFAGLREPVDVLDAGNSGTSLRLVAGLCAALRGLSVLTGDSSLRRRPMLRVVAPLRQMGAVIDGREHAEFPPLAIRGGPLDAIDFELAVASSQVKTAVLLAGLAAEGRTVVRESVATRDHTERMLNGCGVELERRDGMVALAGGQQPEVVDRRIPGDVSSAAYLVAAAILSPGSDLTITDVGLNPTRTAALRVLEGMGASIEMAATGLEGGEPVGTVHVRSSELRGTDIGGSDIPLVIDELPILAVVATQAEGRTVIRDASELRFKESDRIEVMARGLRELGAEVVDLPDGLVISGPTRLTGGEADAYDDHRVALAFAVAGMVTKEKVRIKGWSSIATSFPNFIELVEGARRKR